MGKGLPSPQGAGADPREGQWDGTDNPRNDDDDSKCQCWACIDCFWGQSLPRCALDEKGQCWFLFSVLPALPLPPRILLLHRLLFAQEPAVVSFPLELFFSLLSRGSVFDSLFICLLAFHSKQSFV